MRAWWGPRRGLGLVVKRQRRRAVDISHADVAAGWVRPIGLRCDWGRGRWRGKRSACAGHSVKSGAFSCASGSRPSVLPHACECSSRSLLHPLLHPSIRAPKPAPSHAGCGFYDIKLEELRGGVKSVWVCGCVGVWVCGGGHRGGSPGSADWSVCRRPSRNAWGTHTRCRGTGRCN